MTIMARAKSYTQEMSYIYKYAKIQNNNQNQTQTAVMVLGILKRKHQFLGYLL